jgi:hypothetical protein
MNRTKSPDGRNSDINAKKTLASFATRFLVTYLISIRPNYRGVSFQLAESHAGGLATLA